MFANYYFFNLKAKHPKPKPSAPIGIFDSGIGGLTVANAIKARMPLERIIYFGDTAHLPYGDKAPGSIKNYSLKIAEFLFSQGCKIIVIACNTASSIAYDHVKNNIGEKCPVLDVISPVVDKVSRSKKMKKIGVIGTRATIRSGEYANQLVNVNRDLEVVSVATPLLAPMIEEGFFNNNISRTVINSYLSKPRLKNIDALILACTHYPLIKPEISEYYNGKVWIVDSAEIVASRIHSILNARKLLCTKRSGDHHFYISDYTSSFEKSTKIFFEGKLKLEHLDLWK